MPQVRALLPLLVLPAIGCASPPTEPRLAGQWGGQVASLQLTDSGGAVQYQCGAGTVGPGWTLRQDGAFDATGTHYFGGGPLPATGRPGHPARYSGRLTGDRLMLTVTLTDGSQVLGPFELQRNGPVVQDLCY